MSASERLHQEETLDPRQWDQCRQLGHRMVEEMIEYLRTVRDRPVWQPIPPELPARFQRPLPLAPTPPEDVYAQFKSDILPYPTGNIHPRFWGWVMGTGSVQAMLAEMLAAGINLNQGGGAQAGSLVESQVISWCKEMLGFPSGASGLLVSGGSMANLVGLTVARNHHAPFDVRKEGVSASQKPMRLYASTEVHSSVQKAVELLGFGAQALRLVPVTTDFTLDVSRLREMIRQDRQSGLFPLCLIGCAGTVNTGAIDPLEELANVCREEDLWFHVDGAFGALIALSPDLRSLVKGMERADSLAFDMHKWMYLPYEVGCALIRDADAHRRAFTLTPDYLEHSARGIGGGDIWFSDFGVELSRGFRALKVWMSLKEHGIELFGRLIHQNVEQARHLESLIRLRPELELLAPVSLNIVCFRYRGRRTPLGDLDALNKELLLELHETGLAAVSSTIIRGAFALRACITNHRSKREDFNVLVTEVLRLGKSLEGGDQP
jgi:aromatic-L-amino-acid decarboxylase